MRISASLSLSLLLCSLVTAVSTHDHGKSIVGYEGDLLLTRQNSQGIQVNRLQERDVVDSIVNEVTATVGRLTKSRQGGRFGRRRRRYNPSYFDPNQDYLKGQAYPLPPVPSVSSNNQKSAQGIASFQQAAY